MGDLVDNDGTVLPFCFIQRPAGICNNVPTLLKDSPKANITYICLQYNWAGILTKLRVG